MLSPQDYQFSTSSLVITVSAVTPWRECQVWLLSKGYTLGWSPPLTAAHTLGDVLEGGAPALGASRYGSPVDNCVAIEVSLRGGGSASSRIVPRSAAGPDWKHLFLGARGRLGRIERVTLKVYPLPPFETFRAFRFERLEAACQSVANALQRGSRPSVVFLQPGDALTRVYVRLEGRKCLAEAWLHILRRLSLEAGGVDEESSGVPDFLAYLGVAASSREARPLEPSSPLLNAACSIDAAWKDVPALTEKVLSVTGRHPLITQAWHAGASLYCLEGELAGSSADALAALGGTFPGTAPLFERFFPEAGDASERSSSSEPRDGRSS